MAFVASAYAQTKPEVKDLGRGPKSTLYIGNSFFYYNNMLGSHVTSMTRAVDPANKDKYRSTSVTIGGSGLDWHDVDSYFRPNAIGRYSFDDQNNIIFKARQTVRFRDHNGLQPMSDSSAAETRLPGADSTVCGDGAEARGRADLFYVLGVCRQAGNDFAAR